MSGGRPTDYDPDHCVTVVGLGAVGASKAEMALELGVHRDTFHEWEKKYPEFSDAVKRAVDFAQGWWERQGRLGAAGEVENMNATIYIFNMKNRFKDDWRDKHEVESSGKLEHTHELKGSEKLKSFIGNIAERS